MPPAAAHRKIWPRNWGICGESRGGKVRAQLADEIAGELEIIHAARKRGRGQRCFITLHLGQLGKHGGLLLNQLGHPADDPSRKART